jgi:hypothetical protein
MPSESVPVLLVRLLPGLVGETRRVVHVVPVPAAHVMPDVLTAYCGLQIKPNEAERLDRPTGMPCEPCALNTPSPNTEEAVDKAALPSEPDRR